MTEPVMRELYSAEDIATAVRRLGAEISADHPAGEILLIGVLKGSFIFVADLIRAIEVPTVIDFVRLASYGSDTVSSGIVEFRKDLEMSITDRDVVIVEDIVDSGQTLETLYHLLQQRRPRSLKVCTLIDKRARREVAMEADYVGFTLDDGFILGYGLDVDERYRNLSNICLMSQD
jgi:hypoxanthine phosphoribosyltransferase